MLRAIRCSSLSPNARLVARTLLDYANAATLENCFPCAKTIAKECGLKQTRTVFGALEELEREGYIRREHRYDANGLQTSNLYRFFDPCAGGAFNALPGPAPNAVPGDACNAGAGGALNAIPGGAFSAPRSPQGTFQRSPQVSESARALEFSFGRELPAELEQLARERGICDPHRVWTKFRGFLIEQAANGARALPKNEMAERAAWERWIADEREPRGSNLVQRRPAGAPRAWKEGGWEHSAEAPRLAQKRADNPVWKPGIEVAPDEPLGIPNDLSARPETRLEYTAAPTPDRRPLAAAASPQEPAIASGER
jgi:hypothetical protein